MRIAVGIWIALMLLAWFDGPELDVSAQTPPPQQPCRNDFSTLNAETPEEMDYHIDTADMAMLVGHFGEAVPPADGMFDLTVPPNGFIDTQDITEVMTDFGRECYGTHDEESFTMGGVEGVVPLYVSHCFFDASHPVLAKSWNPTGTSWAVIKVRMYSYCSTDNNSNHSTWCIDTVEANWDTINTPDAWEPQGSTAGVEVWGTTCNDSTVYGPFYVPRFQMLRDRLHHQLWWNPTGQVIHGPHDHAQWYNWAIW